jgi:hypothetical protein
MLYKIKFRKILTKELTVEVEADNALAALNLSFEKLNSLLFEADINISETEWTAIAVDK